jgi:nucleoside 2-deoxyribosyltransferase
MKRIYLASPFFDETGIEKGLVEKVETILKRKGLEIFSPMRNQMEDMQAGSREWSLHTFMNDVKYIDWCEVVVGIYHGNYSDSGTAWELGYAYGTNKPVVLIHVGEDSNLMCHEGAFANISLDELTDYDFNNLKSSFYEGKMF